MINLDTHMLVHALEGTLTKPERALMAGTPWGIAAIVLWELAKLNQLGRIRFDLSEVGIQRNLKAIHVWPLDADVALASTRLDFRGDPADELIAATSVVHRIPLLTRDGVIRKSKVVPLA